MPPPPVRHVGWAVWALAPTAMLAALLGLTFSGAAGPTELADAGPLVRWARPVVTVLWQLGASVTLGGLVLLLFVLSPPPDHARAQAGPRAGRQHERTGRERGAGQAWPVAARAVMIAGPVWASCMVIDLVLGYATVAGRPIGGAGFGDELAFYLTEISTGRAALVAAVLAVVASIACVAVAGYGSAVIAAVLAIAVLIPLATSGHASGSAYHELGMSGLFGHLLFAAVWVGGLVVLCVTASRLGRDLSAAATRYSAVALWCFVGVGVSGAANAWLRLGGWEGFLGNYGALLAVKILIFCGLGAIGLVHRVRTIRTLAPRPDGGAPGAFWRLAAVEILVMGAVMGVAVALADTGPPVPQEAQENLSPAEELSQQPVPPEPTFERWFTQGVPDLLYAYLAAVMAIVYITWVLRLRRRGDRWPLGRTVVWLVGVAGFAWITCGGPAVYGRILFSAHMLQHMTLVMVLPILFVLGAPVTLAVRALPARTDGSRGPREWLLAIVHSRWARLASHPVIAALNFAGSMILFYFTPLFEGALTTHIGHILMVLHFSLAGYVFVNVLIGIDPGPRRPIYPLRLVVLFATMAFHAFFGIAIISMDTLLAADYFGALGLPWGVDALADQETGGEITWGIGEVPSLALAIGVAVQWARSDTREAKRVDRKADRDEDAELEAYNDMMAKMARDSRPG
ncbi:bifunctional copper resistance protein CopD/cytochrome c oxidase assembly protein [Ruania suaedae]|uniref:cytochrome c oxidase assembly protein n=1 Tax=Ruania suaedae TaxID=2897774 RepID=UPI001E411B1C|nr:cytochrome c oxidase assembly protein [Ruania suaedae]UFU02823.1 bifunctional copper resistance protein CopD/cytochrome c oxidase assembly protein [Ruania suaedae]